MDILMPKVGLTMTEGTIVQWHKSEGELVRRGELLFTFETEKSTLEFESPLEGVLSRIVVLAGQLMPCLAPVAEILDDVRALIADAKEDAQKPDDHPEGPGEPAEPRVEGDRLVSERQSEIQRRPISPRARLRARELNVDLDSVPGSGPQGVVLERDILAFQPPPVATRKSIISPVAERVAAELDVDLASVQGSGPEGRITREDVERAAAGRQAPIAQPQSPAANPYGTPGSLQSLTPARRITAQRTAESARTVPHVTITTEADATALVSAREQLNAELNDKVSYNALLIAIAARALKEHPQLNASWTEKGIELHPAINIGVAVDTPRGLYVPVVRDATRPLIQIHRDLAGLVERTLSGSLSGDEFAAGTFTITNLGMYEIDVFTPIINLPQAAILGVGRIQGKPVARDEQVVVRQMMALSLSFDHRVVDGAPAAKFLQRVKALIERPFALMV
jgi:pyruvate dehydrogenase E2 component (dihydrolipoamide acetyltransferase)